MFDINFSQITTEEEHRNFAMTVTATNTEIAEDPARIFVLQDSTEEDGSPCFSCVASAFQMQELPENESNDDTSFFRVHTFSATFMRADQAAEFKEKILYAAQKLANELSLIARTEDETYTITPDL